MRRRAVVALDRVVLEHLPVRRRSPTCARSRARGRRRRARARHQLGEPVGPLVERRRVEVGVDPHHRAPHRDLHRAAGTTRPGRTSARLRLRGASGARRRGRRSTRGSGTAACAGCRPRCTTGWPRCRQMLTKPRTSPSASRTSTIGTPASSQRSCVAGARASSPVWVTKCHDRRRMRSCSALEDRRVACTTASAA